MNRPRDKTGREIYPGDTLKVFHFIGARRKRHYMYKHVIGVTETGYLKVSHLGLEPDYYLIYQDGRTHHGIEIVQGDGGVELGQDFSDRPRLPDMEVRE